MTHTPHDPFHAHVPADPRHFVQDVERGPRGADHLERVAATLADGMTVDDLAGWCVDHPGGAPHVLATLDALAAV